MRVSPGHSARQLAAWMTSRKRSLMFILSLTLLGLRATRALALGIYGGRLSSRVLLLDHPQLQADGRY